LADEMKTVLIHTALSARDDFGPTYKVGWGSIRADDAVKLVRGERSAAALYRFKVRRGEQIELKANWLQNKDARVTMVWIDPPLQTSGPKDLVNDLDLTVKGPDGHSEYFPWSLNPASPSQKPTRSGNHVDNVERVDIPLPKRRGGQWTIRITTDPNHFSSSNPSQEFALAVSGLVLRK
jgi:hypothetical protein